MKGRATHSASPLAVDEGDALDLFSQLRRALRATPGRFTASVRITVVALLVVAISEALRVPDTALSAFIVLFLAGSNAASTLLMGTLSAITAVLAILAAIAIFMISLSEPALRLSLMVVATFIAMFLSQASTQGAIFFTGGFIVAYGLTLGDELAGLALQPATVGNGPNFELPEIAFVPATDALVLFMLWLGVSVVMPVVVLIIADLLTGTDPARLLRDALAERLTTIATFFRGRDGARRRLEAEAFEGTAGLHKLYHLSGMLHGGRHRPVWPASLIDDVARLGLLLLAWPRVAVDSPDALAPLADGCEEAARAARGQPANPEMAAIAATGAARPLADSITQTSRAIGAPLGTDSRSASTVPHRQSSPPRRLLVPDAFSNPQYVRFALKVTLAVMICYFVMNIVDWPGIHTCVITCYIVALGTFGDTLHKATLRIVGCMIGAALGLGAILLLMPLMTGLGDLLLLLAPVTLLAVWISRGSQRTSYAGLQIGLAFYLVVLQGFGPTIDMDSARDRTVGILFGNIVIFAVFSSIWPVSVADVVRTNVAKALESLSALFKLEDGRSDSEMPWPARSAAEAAFRQAIAQAQSVLVNDRYETRSVRQATGRRAIDAIVVTEIERLLIPISAILDLRADAGWREVPERQREAIVEHHHRLAEWFQLAASWVRTGRGEADVIATFPRPPALGGPVDHLAARATWYGILHQDIGGILDEVGPRPILAPSERTAVHAAE
jgi:multidrug resistance protein MdtO